MSEDRPPIDAGLHVPQHPVRVLTAAALFDGHDAAINIMRRILQSQGAEVIHLGHNRSVDEVALAAIQEDVQAVAISSYQGGHVEFFEYLVNRLRRAGAEHIRVFGGGGGTIVPAEIEYLHSVGVARIFSPEDGQRLGLAKMVNTILAECDQAPRPVSDADVTALFAGDSAALARTITALENRDRPGRRHRPDPRARRLGRRARHHRHRWVRQVLAHRRADPPAAAGPAGQVAHRGAGDRPDPATRRRRAAR